MSFEPAKAKLTIGSLDEDITVTAQYNPKEVQIDRTVPWKKPDAANKTGADADAAKKAEEKSRAGGGFGAKKDDNYMTLEFTGGEGRSMTVEMLFDEYEGSGRTIDVVAQVAALDAMAKVRNPTSSEESERRPHHCIVTWGARGMPNFKCVIEQLSTKYTMFSSDGKPLRATCTVKLKEANQLERKATS
jgi:hypothetical protein